MTSALTYNLKGEQLEKTTLPREIFGAKVNGATISQAIRVFLANQRAGSAKTKTRGEVAKTTAKMFKQKGTGRARHGSWAAPIFVGGGIAHGPSGEQNYKLSMPAKMKRAALFGVLSEKAGQNQVVVISGSDKASGKTREASELWIKIGGDKRRALLVTRPNEEKFNRAWRNLAGISLVNATQMNPYVTLREPKILITKSALEELVKNYVK